jgi:hypothetical protein
MARKKKGGSSPDDGRHKAAPTRAREKPVVSPSGVAELATAERRLLALLVDPKNLGRTATELADAAGIHRATYYRLLRNPEFSRKRNEVLLQAIRDVSPALKALVNTAAIEGKEGAADRRLLLEVAGIYRPRMTVEQTAARNVDGDMPDEEALWWYQRLKYEKALWLPSIRQRFEAGQLKPRKPAHLEADADSAI